MSAVSVAREGFVTIVTLSRPDVRNAVDRSTAEALATANQLAQFPQTCMRGDRLSAYEQFSMTLEDALANEFQRGSATIASGETSSGAARFAAGAGRHGATVGATESKTAR